MKRYFEISIHALVITAFAALAMTGRLDAPSIVIFIMGVGWSLYRTLRSLPALLGVRSTLFLSCGYIVFLAFDIFVLSNSFIPATVHMVMFLELAKLYQKKAERDYFYLIVLAFLMVLAAASLTIDITFAVMLFLFLVALVATLMSFEVLRSRNSSAIATHNPAVSLTGISVWASLWIVVVGAVLFFLIPRLGTGYFSRATIPTVLQSGFSDNVRLGEIGQIKLSSAIVMRAKRVSGRPNAGLRWRGIALDRFDGRSWHKTELNREEVPLADNGAYSINPLEHPSDGVRYDILLEPMATATLFAPYRVRSVTSRQDGIAVDHEDSIFVRVQQQHRVQYQVLSEIPDRTRPVSSTLVPENALRYLQLPENLDPHVTELAREITVKETTPIEKALAIEDYLRKNYQYTLNLTWKPGPQPLNTFLFEAKNGHCEYFASALAILDRAAGIPTRLVNGFQMGEFNPVGSDYIVRESDAHSWVEAFIPGRGWMEFDATPPDMRPADTGMVAQVSHYVDAMELVWSTYILVYDSNNQSQLFRSAQDRAQILQSDFRNGSDRWSAWAADFTDRASNALNSVFSNRWSWIILLIAVSAAGFFQKRRTLRARWQIFKLRRGRGAANSVVIEHLFYRVARLAQRRRPSRIPAQTWREWTLGISDANRRSIAMNALGVFEKSLYGQDPPSNADFALLENAIRALKE